MHRLCLILAVAALAGCASSPPLPPECEGTLVPINGAAQRPAQGGGDAARPRS